MTSIVCPNCGTRIGGPRRIRKSRPAHKRAEATKFLRAELGRGPLRSSDLKRKAAERNISMKTLRSACEAVCIVAEQVKGVPHGGWTWRLSEPWE